MTVEALRSSESSVTISQISRRHIPENNIQGHRRENLKSSMKAINTRSACIPGKSPNYPPEFDFT
jgi:hypothetical protein